MYRHISKHLVVSLSLAALLVVSGLWGANSVWAASCYDDCLGEGNTPTECRAACANWTEPPLSKFQETVGSEVLAGETHLHWSINTLINSLLTLMVGREQQSGETDSGGDDTYRSGGALGGITTLIAVMYANPPASGVEYLADLGRNLGIVSPAYAQQGVGFSGLTPILPIWKAFRDVAYIFFVIIFIAAGLAIMFRVKISPQAVMTIQSAIPRVVVALILVTFSYAIAGFLIDLMYLLIALVAIGFGTAQCGADPCLDAGKAQQYYFGANPLTLLGEFMTRGVAVAERVGEIFAPESFSPDIVAGIIEWMTRTVPGLQVLRVPSNLIILILTIVLLFAFFKLFFALLSAYVKILIAIIFGPLQIMLGALPGQDAFLGWLRGVLSNVLVFPAAIAMFLLADVLLVATEKGGKLWAPPFLRTEGLSVSGNFLGGLIAYGILLMTPKVVEMVQQALQVKPYPYGAAIGEAMGPVTGVVGTGRRLGITAGAETVFQRGRAVGGPWPAGTPREAIIEAIRNAIQKQA